MDGLGLCRLLPALGLLGGGRLLVLGAPLALAHPEAQFLHVTVGELARITVAPLGGLGTQHDGGVAPRSIDPCGEAGESAKVSFRQPVLDPQTGHAGEFIYIRRHGREAQRESLRCDQFLPN